MLRDRLALTGKPWFVRVIAVWLLTRMISTAVFLTAANLQGDNFWTKARPGYFDFLNIWDAQWYWRIFDHGYPHTLPLNADGSVAQNEWAFLPLFPALVRLANLASGIEWRYLAPVMSTLFSFAFALVLYRLFTRFGSTSVSLWAVFIVGIWCASPVLQTGYAESLGLIFFAWSLILIHDRKYLLALIPIALLTFTRPGSLAIALLLALVFAVRWFKERQATTFSLVERMRLLVATLAAGILGFGWMLTAWLITGRPDAYIATELAWRGGYLPAKRLIPFEGWFASFNFHFGYLVGIFALITFLLWVTWMLSLPSVRQLTTLHLWVIAYFVYLLVVFLPQSSTWRLLLPAFPLALALAESVARASRWARVLLVLTAIGLQFWWVLTCWNYSAPDFTPP